MWHLDRDTRYARFQEACRNERCALMIVCYSMTTSMQRALITRSKGNHLRLSHAEMRWHDIRVTLIPKAHHLSTESAAEGSHLS